MKGLLLILAGMVASTACANAAEFETTNFVVTADDAGFAQTVAEQAETFRAELAEQLFGELLLDWEELCLIEVFPGERNTATTVYKVTTTSMVNMKMEMYGTREGILEASLPHEICHLILADYFGNRMIVPRWADEGIAMYCEEEVERAKHRQRVTELIQVGTYCPTQLLIRVIEYPKDRDQRLDFYLQSYSLVEFLITQKGVETLRDFIRDGCSVKSLERNYNIPSFLALDSRWLTWVENGMTVAAQ